MTAAVRDRQAPQGGSGTVTRFDTRASERAPIPRHANQRGGEDERGRASGNYFVPWNSRTTMMRTTTTARLLPGEGIPTRAFHFAIATG